MRNKQLYIRRIERMEGALRAIEVSLGQRDTTLQSIRQRLETVNNELDERRGMGERESKSYEIDSRTNSKKLG